MTNINLCPDRRNFKRYKYEIPVNVFLSGVEDACQTVNISEGGLAFKTRQRYYRIGQYIKCQFIDTDAAGHEAFFQLDYRIVRIANIDKHHVIGCECTSKPEEASRYARLFESKIYYFRQRNNE